MTDCAICTNLTNADQINKLFLPEVCHNLRKLIKNDLATDRVCFRCYIKIGTISCMLNTFYYRKARNYLRPQEIDPEKHYCQFCFVEGVLKWYRASRMQYIQYINRKLNRPMIVGDHFTACDSCAELVDKLNDIMEIYHECKLLVPTSTA